MRKMVLILLSCYLGTLAITQTAYGSQFMTARWLALLILFLIAGLCWFSTKPPSRSKANRVSSTATVLIYLSITFLTVIMAENPLFSGMKWASHATMIFVFLIFLWQSLTIKQASQALDILKLLLALLLLVSLVKPVTTIHSEDVALFRGSFGSPNSMGQIAAIGALLYFHTYLTGKPGKRRYLEIIMTCIAAWLVWSSGARSAMVASITGLILMSYFYRDRLRGKALWAVLFIACLAFAIPDLPKAGMHFVLRGSTDTKTFSEQIFKTRSSVWTAAWEGFRKRPLFGWGFGADDRISQGWEAKLTSLGTVSRDNVNDTLIVLESTGVVGLIGYLLLVILVLKQIPTRSERSVLAKIHAPPLGPREVDFSAYNVHAIAFSIAASLLVTVQFDNTALSAGNFLSVVLWLSVALAGAVKRKVIAYEEAASRYRKLSKRLYSKPYQDVSIPPPALAPSDSRVAKSSQ